MVDVDVDGADHQYDLGRMKGYVQAVRSLVCVWGRNYTSLTWP